MKQDNEGWSFSDWVVIAFLALMIAGLLSAFFGPPAPIEPGFLER